LFGLASPAERTHNVEDESVFREPRFRQRRCRSKLANEWPDTLYKIEEHALMSVLHAFVSRGFGYITPGKPFKYESQPYDQSPKSNQASHSTFVFAEIVGMRASELRKR
jgi:hypothetical protein